MYTYIVRVVSECLCEWFCVHLKLDNVYTPCHLTRYVCIWVCLHVCACTCVCTRVCVSRCVRVCAEADCVIQDKHINDSLVVRYFRAASVGRHVYFRQHSCFDPSSRCTFAAMSNHLACCLSKTFSFFMNAIGVSTYCSFVTPCPRFWALCSTRIVSPANSLATPVHLFCAYVLSKNMSFKDIYMSDLHYTTYYMGTTWENDDYVSMQHDSPLHNMALSARYLNSSNQSL